MPFIINLLRCASTRVSRRVQWKGHAAAHEAREAGYPYTCSLLPPYVHAYSRSFTYCRLPRREFAAKQQLLPLLEAAKDKQKQRTAAAGARK